MKKKRMKEDFYRGKHYTNEKGEHVCEQAEKALWGKEKTSRLESDFTAGIVMMTMLCRCKILVKDVETSHDVSYRAFEQIVYHTKDKDDSWVD